MIRERRKYLEELGKSKEKIRINEGENRERLEKRGTGKAEATENGESSRKVKETSRDG